MRILEIIQQGCLVCRWGRQPVEDAIVGVQQSLVNVLMDAGAKLRLAFQRDVLLEASRDANLGVIWLMSSCAADFSRSNYDLVRIAMSPSCSAIPLQRVCASLSSVCCTLAARTMLPVCPG